MKFVRVIACILLFLVICLSFGCNNGNAAEDPNDTGLPTTTTVMTPATTTMTPAATELPPSPVEIRLELSPLPLVGQVCEWIFSINIKELWERPQFGLGPSEGLVDARAWLSVAYGSVKGSYQEARKFSEVPIEDILIEGNSSWEGNAIDNMNIEIIGTIRLPREGIWIFEGNLTGENWSEPVTYRRWIAVADGIVMSYWDKKELKASPLAYLTYFDYGGMANLRPTEERPVLLELDMSKPPLAGEEVTLTYRVSSPYIDVQDFSARTRFFKTGVGKVPASDVLVSGDLEWVTDFKKDELVELSAVIKFPEPGEWQIQLLGSYPIQPYGMGNFVLHPC